MERDEKILNVKGAKQGLVLCYSNNNNSNNKKLNGVEEEKKKKGVREIRHFLC